MQNIIEEVLKLSKEEKMKLYQALQEDLEENVLHEDELTQDQWIELNKRIGDIESGKAKLISRGELEEFLKNRRNAIQAEGK